MVRLSGGIQCTSTTLFIINIICLLSGCSILSLGIYIKVNGHLSDVIVAYNITQAFGEAAMRWIETILIIIGALTICLTACGCLGALCYNRVFLYVYSVILLLMILLEFISIIVALRFRNDLWKSYDSAFQNIFQRAYHNNQTQTIQIIEQLEREFQCCGAVSFTDYGQFGYKISSTCYPNQLRQEIPFKQGCAEAIVIWIWNELPIIAGILASILFFEIFGIITSLVIGVAISHSSNTDVYFKL